jgi:hypothetical protein
MVFRGGIVLVEPSMVRGALVRKALREELCSESRFLLCRPLGCRGHLEVEIRATQQTTNT